MIPNGKLFLVAFASLLVFAACSQRNKPPLMLPDDPAMWQETPRTGSKKSGKPQKKTTLSRIPRDWKELEPATPKPFVGKALGHRIARVDVPGPYVALTFDDGPNPDTTPKILDILRQYGVHGTFFVAGRNAAKNPQILARAVAEGNEIGCHTYSHINLLKSGPDKVDSEMRRCLAIIRSATGRSAKLMRPPYGATNKVMVEKIFDNYGLTSVLWDVDTRDWEHPGVQTVINRAVGRARAGSIILVHDIHASTLAAVEGIITGLQARGFKLVTVSQLMALGSPRKVAPLAPEQPEAQAESTAPAVQSVPADAPPPAPTVDSPGEAAAAASSHATTSSGSVHISLKDKPENKE